MMNESPPNDRLKTVWQNQPSEGIRMSVEEIRHRAGKFQKKVYWRNVRENVAALIVVVAFGYHFWQTSDTLTRVACGLIIAGTLYVMWRLHQWGASRSVPAEMGLASGLEFHRRELARQRDLLRKIWSWYLAPVIPGLAVLMAAKARINPGHLRPIGLTIALIVLVYVFTWWLNHRAARCLQSRIDDLNALEGQR
jgi:hypothetical protein